MYFISKDFMNEETLDWKRVWGGVFLPFARALNRINRWSLKPATVTRQMITPNTILHVNGLRDNTMVVWYDKNSQVGSTDASNAWSVYKANIKVSNPVPGSLIKEVENSPYSALFISYSLDILYSDGPPAVTDYWEAKASVDGQGFPAGDSFNNIKFNVDAASTGGSVNLSASFTALVLPGEHILSLELFVPTKSAVWGAEINIQRMNW